MQTEFPVAFSPLPFQCYLSFRRITLFFGVAPPLSTVFTTTTITITDQKSDPLLTDFPARVEVSIIFGAAPLLSTGFTTMASQRRPHDHQRPNIGPFLSDLRGRVVGFRVGLSAPLQYHFGELLVGPRWGDTAGNMAAVNFTKKRNHVDRR